MAVVLSLLVASLCVIKKVSNRQIWAHFLKLFFQRQEEERFKKIDAKRGGRGFV
jgi:phosphopantetheinyl transferase